MCSALIRMLNFKQANTSFLTWDITLGDLDDFLLMIDTFAWLSIWNKKIMFLKDSPQIFKAITTGNNSRKVMSVKIPDETHELDQHAWAHFRYGTTVILDQFWSSNYELNLFSDSAGGKGKGFGICSDRKWVQACWSNSWVSSGILTDITFLELFPVVIALNIWGESLRKNIASSVNKSSAECSPGTIVCHAKFRDPNKDCKSCNEILVQAKQDSILFRNSISNVCLWVQQSAVLYSNLFPLPCIGLFKISPAVKIFYIT
jgi:hypothetical protein